MGSDTPWRCFCFPLTVFTATIPIRTMSLSTKLFMFLPWGVDILHQQNFAFGKHQIRIIPE